MKILISNDDGIHASGIRALIEKLALKHEVYVIAPDRERSAAGHSLTLHSPLRVEELTPRFGEKRSWMITGTPGDCVKIGLNAILEEHEKPDLIISGINHGPNLGSDILYSGTVSAALEGAVLGYPSIAVSLANATSDGLEYFYYTANFISKLIPRVQELSIPHKNILNINVPYLMDDADIAGVAITKLGTRMYTDTYEKRVDPRGKIYYWMAGELVKSEAEEGSDINAIRNNKISITPVTFELTAGEIMPDLKKVLCSDGKCDWI